MQLKPHQNSQTAAWYGCSGHAWAGLQDLLDRVFQPFEELLVNAVTPVPDGALLDVGCGSGATTIAAARRLGGGSRCTGVDISEAQIAAARARAAALGAPVEFLCADAGTHAFAPASFNRIISRFGVMFFEDPVRAFSHLRTAAKGGAELRFLAWRDAAENPFMTTAERAAAPVLPGLPPRLANAPGQFAFADADRVRDILARSGWAGASIEAVDVHCTMPEAELTAYFTALGPVGQALARVDDAVRSRVIDVVRAAFAPYVEGAEVRFTAACWLAAARTTSDRVDTMWTW